jgi:hypothetical protein
VLDQDVVLEHRDLGPITALADHHDPLDGFAAGQELRLGQDRWTRPALFPAIPAALALGLEPGRTGHALHFIAGGTARRAHLDDRDHAVVGASLGLSGAATAAATAAPGERLVLIGAGRRLRLGLGLLGDLELVGRALAAPAAPPAAAATGSASGSAPRRRRRRTGAPVAGSAPAAVASGAAACAGSTLGAALAARDRLRGLRTISAVGSGSAGGAMNTTAVEGAARAGSGGATTGSSAG